MAVCTYDNPATYTRECWRDGRLLISYSWDFFLRGSGSQIPSEYLFFGANVGGWKGGRIIGDKAAMDASPPEDCEPLPIIVHKQHYDQLRGAGFTNIALSVYDLEEGADASPQE